MARQSLWFRGGGAPKRGWYKGYWCDSSWELAFLIWHLDHGREITRNTHDFPYSFRTGVKYYRPDFLVGGQYVEIKGVLDGRSKRKIANFPYPLLVVGKKEIQPYLDYAAFKYGRNWADLLEPPTG